ncbi:hypothetical protein SLEP1_g58755 [Rubroshorea leprosula]|uniref:Uncharacterized protein n=1 Tax=Rubroshorea leprosula TaxID=152421 RepID=A0AAV5MT55_9ROSI|nr:hypothetical protein SLEP1_g58755 [Rubroshorea leprosula]
MQAFILRLAGRKMNPLVLSHNYTSPLFFFFFFLFNSRSDVFLSRTPFRYAFSKPAVVVLGFFILFFLKLSPFFFFLNFRPF